MVTCAPFSKLLKLPQWDLQWCRRRKVLNCRPGLSALWSLETSESDRLGQGCSSQGGQSHPHPEWEEGRGWPWSQLSICTAHQSHFGCCHTFGGPDLDSWQWGQNLWEWTWCEMKSARGSYLGLHLRTGIGVLGVRAAGNGSPTPPHTPGCPAGASASGAKGPGELFLFLHPNHCPSVGSEEPSDFDFSHSLSVKLNLQHLSLFLFWDCLHYVV